MNPILELRDVRLRLGKADILRGISLPVQAGERVALIGPNGAGKSTLFDVISGRRAPGSGSVLLHGQRIDGRAPFEVHRRGLSRSFQITSLFGRLSVRENLRCALLWSLGYRYPLLRWGRPIGEIVEKTEYWLSVLGLEGRSQTASMDLTYAEQRALELGVTLAGNAQVVLLDEPTAGMSRTETSRFVELIRRASSGRTLLIVEHDMSVVFELADRLAVLEAGELIACGPPQAVRREPRVQAAYLGSLHAPSGKAGR